MKLMSQILSSTFRVEIGRHLHIERLMRSIVVVAVDEVIETGLLLQFSEAGFVAWIFQGQVHAVVSAVLLRMAGLDAFDVDAEPTNEWGPLLPYDTLAQVP